MSGSDFCNQILGCFADLVKSIDPANPSAAVRRRILRTFHRCWGGLRSSATCFFCLNREPEHMLSCRHAMCDNCVVVFGCRSPTVGHHLDVTRCPLCDAEVHLAVRQLPPTKGPNILSLDGGGVRGIRQLGLLRSLEERLGGDLLPAIFDLCVGTSVGMFTVKSLHKKDSSLGGLAIAMF
jgi:hypothetical protein